jgi:hypothetical protein
VGSDRLLLGTHYPFPMDDRNALKSLEQAGCSSDEIAHIGGATAQYQIKL